MLRWWLWRWFGWGRLGQAGEARAAFYLQLRGYRILERNARYGRHEIDLIVRRGDTIAFVEVKTRRHDDAVDPADNVGPTKQHHLRLAAGRYQARHPEPDRYYRFDIVAIHAPERGRATITHLPDAFR